MNALERIRIGLRLWWHKREIEAALRYHDRCTGKDARKRKACSESGSFQSQIYRLFRLGTAEETGELQTIASTAVNACLSNTYYRPADFLSDFIDALESRTVLSMEPDGEAPLQELEPRGRKLKIERVMRSWLVPVKVAAVESVLAEVIRGRDRSPAHPGLGRLERQAARLFALVDESEVRLVEERVLEFIETWRTDEGLRPALYGAIPRSGRGRPASCR